MRILFATTHNHLPQCSGGMEVNTDALAHDLRARGHTVEVFCSFTERRAPDRLRRRASRLLGRTLMTDRVRGYRVWRAMDVLGRVEEAIARSRPDVVVVQGWDSHNLARPFLRRGLPTLIYVHTADRFEFDAELADSPHLRFAVNSNFTATLHPDKRVDAVFPCLIEPDAYRVKSRRERVLFVNPVPEKGLSVAVALAAARPDVSFDFLECWKVNHASREAARRLVADLPNVRWLASTSDMRPAYGRARLVLFPSAMETWGRVATEGHISGIPTLGSDRGSLVETIGPGGVCVPLEAPVEAWLAAFSRLWDDPVAYAGYARAALAFSRRAEVQPEVITAAFAQLLEGMATSASPPENRAAIRGRSPATNQIALRPATSRQPSS